VTPNWTSLCVTTNLTTPHANSIVNFHQLKHGNNRSRKLIARVSEGKSQTGIMRPYHTPKTTMRCLMRLPSTALHCPARAISLEHGKPESKNKEHYPDTNCRLVLTMRPGTHPVLDSMREVFWSPAKRTSWTNVTSRVVLIHYLPLLNMPPLYESIMKDICREQSEFLIGIGRPFLYKNSPDPGIGLALPVSKTITDICNTFLSAVEGNVDRSLIREASSLYMPLCRGLPKVETRDLLARVMSSYPDGIPCGLATSLAIVSPKEHKPRYIPRAFFFRKAHQGEDIPTARSSRT
jgi:hypothetical protein